MSAGGPKRPETDPAQAEPGDRAYEDLPVRDVPQVPISAGASEPSDMGAPDPGTEPPPHERPRADGGGCRG